MPLTNEEIAKLLAGEQQKKRKGGRTAGGKKLDVSVRDYETWFKLAHHMLDQDTGQHLTCDNPNCIDPRPRAPIVAEVNGQHMCRHCFLDGWQLLDLNQQVIDATS